MQHPRTVTSVADDEPPQRILQLVPAQPNTWLVNVHEVAFGTSEGPRGGWRTNVVTRYEITTDPVDCWALIDTVDPNGVPTQAVAPLCMSWMLAAQHAEHLAAIATPDRRGTAFDHDRGRREVHRVMAVRAGSAEEARQLAEQKHPPSGPIRETR